jgi:hypothetical protein
VDEKMSMEQKTTWRLVGSEPIRGTGTASVV